MLGQMGYEVGELTGTLTPETITAIVLYQTDEGLTADGQPTVELRDQIAMRFADGSARAGTSAPASGTVWVTLDRAVPGPEDADPACPGGLTQKMRFAAPLEGGEIGDFSYSFAMKTRFYGDETGPCLDVDRSGELISGLVEGSEFALTVLETDAVTGTETEVFYRGTIFDDGTAELIDLGAPYEALPMTVETGR